MTKHRERWTAILLPERNRGGGKADNLRVKLLKISLLAALLLLTSCADATRSSQQYDSLSGSNLAGQNSGDLLLTLNPNKNYSKAWYVEQFGPVPSGPGVISFASQPAFEICSQLAQTAYPDWGTNDRDRYIDYLAGCQIGLGWTDKDTGLVDLN